MPTDFKNVLAQTKNAHEKEEKVEELVQLVVFELDGEEYAVSISDLREIIRIPEIAPVPNTPDFIRGILNLRGEVVVVLDLEKRFNLVRSGKGTLDNIIITDIDGNTFGLMVDKVNEVLRVPVSKIQNTPEIVSSRIHVEYLKGVVVIEKDDKSRLVILLDIPKLLKDVGNVAQNLTAN